MPSIAEVVKTLNKQFKQNEYIVRGDVVKKTVKLPTKALGMDYPLYGGLPLGYIAVYSGLPHSGKTTAACCELAAYQQAFPDRPCVYVDAEHRLQLDFQMMMNGVDISKLIYVDIPVGMSGEQVLDTVIELEKADDVGMIIIDSLPALIPAAVLKSDMTEDPGMRATMAKKFYSFLNEMQTMLSSKGNILICINQVRDGGQVNGIQIWKEPCGGAPQFLSTVSVRFGKRKFVCGDDEVTDEKKADGFRLHFKITKNSTAALRRGGGFITYRYDTGIDSLYDMLKIAEDFDFIKKNGSYRTLVNHETGEAYVDENGKELKGYMKDLKEYINTHDKFREEYVNMLHKCISGTEFFGTLLSDEQDKEIEAEETAVEKSRERESEKYRLNGVASKAITPKTPGPGKFGIDVDEPGVIPV